jgi:hypothetical protein
MKRPLSVIIVTRDPATQREVHNRFDVETGFPRLRLVVIFFKAFFSAMS